MKKMWFLWMLAFAITIFAAYYQALTGPTYPVSMKLNINGSDVKVKLPRTHGGETDCPVELKDVPLNKNFCIVYRKYPTSDPYDTLYFSSIEGVLTANLPNQPPAGKLQYYLVNLETGESYFQENQVKIRFKGDVPAGVLIPHILFIFTAMLLSNLTALIALIRKQGYRKYVFASFIAILIGGMIMGPIVQKYAFGEYWTGIPFGWDLTDNKTLIAFAGWVLAFLLNLKVERKAVVIFAAVLTLVIFSIPHSMFGSELDQNTGQVITGPKDHQE